METSAAIYVRRSALDDREGDNHSLGAQERECREWAEREGLTVGPVYRKMVSELPVWQNYGQARGTTR